ncbi:MAG: hypothetical protein AB4290_00445 [Spirulina sp.]
MTTDRMSVTEDISPSCQRSRITLRNRDRPASFNPIASRIEKKIAR